MTESTQKRFGEKPAHWIIIAALSGAVVVALGALGAHALKRQFNEYQQGIWAKAALYQMFHTMALFALSLMAKIYPSVKPRLAGLSFLTGILLFSGSLYLLALSGLRFFGMITPFGGVSFIAGWALVAYEAKRLSALE